jgi:glucose-6-phosphate dehydrogenase assembly protein OpcA
MDWAKEYGAREFTHGTPKLALIQLTTWDYAHSPVGMSDRSLEVSEAIARMRDTFKMGDPYRAAIAHHLFSGAGTTKAKTLGWDKITYWRNLHSAHVFIAARIEQPSREVA